MLELPDFVNEVSQSARIANVPGYVFAAAEASPIDDFYSSLMTYLNMGEPNTLRDNDVMGRLLVIGIISAAENYFRSIISGVVNICPLAQTLAADRPVTLGAVTWHTGKRYNRSALEHSSLADAKGLKSAFRDCVGLNLTDANFSDSLTEYEKICQLRHGIVHNDGFVPGKNAIKLEIPRVPHAARIIVRYDQLQEIGAVTNGLVRLINREVFVTLCKRWAIDWRRRSDWYAGEEDAAFSKIWELCLSKNELALRLGRSKITKKACATRVRQDFGLR